MKHTCNSVQPLDRGANSIMSESVSCVTTQREPLSGRDDANAVTVAAHEPLLAAEVGETANQAPRLK